MTYDLDFNPEFHPINNNKKDGTKMAGTYPINFVKQTTASDLKTKNMRKVIKNLIYKSIYPSAARISTGLGRNTKTLNGPECVTRRQIFKDLGISLAQPKTGFLTKYQSFMEEFRVIQ